MEESVFKLLQEAYIKQIAELEEDNKILVEENERLEGAADYWSEEYEDLKLINTRLSNSCDELEEEVYELRDEIKELNSQLDEESFDSDTCELNLNHSQELLESALPMLVQYRNIHSNNPNLYVEISSLTFRIEEQIIKNGQ
jgi:predicted nuclease with TOPRIM domain